MREASHQSVYIWTITSHSGEEMESNYQKFYPYCQSFKTDHRGPLHTNKHTHTPHVYIQQVLTDVVNWGSFSLSERI